MTFLVIAQRHGYDTQAMGPYRSFKRAEADAQAWDRVKGFTTIVVPITKPDDFAAWINQPSENDA